MKELKLYMCEICNTQFKEKASAMNCEKSHRKFMQIVGHRFTKGTEYPHSVTIEFENGKKVRYDKGPTLGGVE